MPPAKSGVGSRAAQLIGLSRKFMVLLTCPTHEIASTESKVRQNENKTKQNNTKSNIQRGAKQNSTKVNIKQDMTGKGDYC